MKKTQTESGSSSHVSTARRNGRGVTMESTVGSAHTRENKTRGWQNLPYPEYVKQREERKCFQCGGPPSPGHKCPDKNLRVLILGENDKDKELEEGEDEDPKQMKSFVFSARGLTQTNTMKLQG